VQPPAVGGVCVVTIVTARALAVENEPGPATVLEVPTLVSPTLVFEPELEGAAVPVVDMELALEVVLSTEDIKDDELDSHAELDIARLEDLSLDIETDDAIFPKVYMDSALTTVVAEIGGEDMVDTEAELALIPNSVVIIELTIVVEDLVIVTKEVAVAVGIRQDTVPLFWISIDVEFAVPPSRDIFIQLAADWPEHSLREED
jgi:hypothetical protein